jgi:DNA-binding CsgD family transcriptional regulator
MMPGRQELTAPELRVLRAIVDHGTIHGAARALNLSPHTVDTHLDRLRKKIGLHYLPQLTAWAALHGWLPIDPEP